MTHKHDHTNDSVKSEAEEPNSSDKTTLNEEHKHVGSHHRKSGFVTGASETEEDQNAEPHGHARAHGHGKGHKDGHGRCKRLEAELEEEKQRSAEYLDLARRKQAEFENFRKRTDSERAKIGEAATANVIQKLLAPLDDLDRAIESSKVGGEYQELLKGVEMIREQVTKLFKELGLEEISPENEPFDPNLHEAVMAIESDEHEDEHVREVFQKGYKLKDRVIRPAKVQVSKKK